MNIETIMFFGMGVVVGLALMQTFEDVFFWWKTRQVNKKAKEKKIDQ